MVPQLRAKAMAKPTSQLMFSCLTRKVTTAMVTKNNAMWSQYLPSSSNFSMRLAMRYCRNAVVACTKRLVQAAPTE